MSDRLSYHKKIAIVIVNYNNWQDTMVCMESVLAGSPRPEWVILVDNASTNDSLRWLRHWSAGNLDFILEELGIEKAAAKPIFMVEHTAGAPAPPVPEGAVFIIPMAVNRGYAAGNNAGISLGLSLGADAVWIVNNDTMIEKEALGYMRAALFAQKNPGLCGSLVVYMDSGLVQCMGGGKMNKWTGLSTLAGNGLSPEEALRKDPETVRCGLDFIYGASVMVSSDFINTVGLMDESYFLYCEEQDWGARSKKQFDFAYAPQAVVKHKEGGATGFSNRKKDFRSLFRLTRSRLLLTWKHAPYAIPTVCLGIVFAAFRMALRRIILQLNGAEAGVRGTELSCLYTQAARPDKEEE